MLENIHVSASIKLKLTFVDFPESLSLLGNVLSMNNDCEYPENLCGRERDIIGVKAGEGTGVGSSLIGDKHLFVFDGTSSKIVVLFNVEFIVVLVDDLYAFPVSELGSSMDMLGNG